MTLALRVRPAVDSPTAQFVAQQGSDLDLVRVDVDRYGALILLEETLSLPEGAVLEIEFRLETTQEMLIRFFATSEEEPRWWYRLRSILGQFPIHGWLALATVSSYAGESDRARAALDRIDVEEFDGMELALMALTHHKLGDEDMAQDWYERLNEWLKQQPPDSPLQNLADFVRTKVSGK